MFSSLPNVGWSEKELVETSLLLIWLFLELLFFCYYSFKKHRLDKEKDEKRMAHLQSCFNKELRRTLWRQCMAIHRHEYKEFFSGWFFGVPFHEIKKDNVLEWLSWAFLSCELNALNGKEKEEIEEFLDDLKEIGCSFPEGRNETIKSIRLTFDPVLTEHRPLFFYVSLYLLNWFVYLVLFLRGFRYRNTPAFSYWFLIPPQQSSFTATTTTIKKQRSEALVLLHGIGMGLIGYLRLIAKMWKIDIPLFLIEQRHITMMNHFGGTIPTMHEFVSSIDEMLLHHDFSSAFFVGHSLGTVNLGWVMKERRERVSGAIMVDPVCFRQFGWEIPFNFIHRPPSSFYDRLISFVGKEITIATYLSRHFNWSQNLLLAEQVCCSTTVFLSSYDSIVPSTKVDSYLKNSANPYIRTDTFSCGHALFLAKDSALDKVVETIQSHLYVQAY